MAITDIVLTGYVFQDDGDALQGATVQLLETGTTTEETSYSGGTTSAGLWTFTETSLDTTYDIKITSGTSVRYRNWADEIALKGIDTSYAKIRGTEGAAAPLYFFADQADDAGDAWRIQASASDTLAIGSDKASAGTIIDYVTITNGANAAASVVALGGSLTVGNALTVTGTTTLNGNLVLGDAAADTLTIGATLQGASPLNFEGATADGYETTFAITDPTADRTITFPNLTGTVVLGGVSNGSLAITTTGAADLGATTVDSLTSTGTITGGSDGSGVDVVLYSGTTGDNLTWDASEEQLIITGTNGTTSLNVADGNVAIADDLAVDGTSNLDNTDIDGTLVVDGSNISLDSTATLNIDNSNTSNGITIATATSGVPISIGHATSETTVNDNLNVTGTSVLATVDINAGAIDGVTLGTNSAITNAVIDDISINGKVITMTGDTSDTTVITAGSAGTLSIVTTDAAGADADIQITADGTAELAGTTVTLDSAADIELEATDDINIPVDVGLTFGDDGQKIESDGTDFTIASGAKLNLTPTSDVHFANGTGVVIGHTAQVTTASVAEFQILGTGAADSSAVIGRWTSGASGPRLSFVASNNGTIGSNTIVADNDIIGFMEWLPDDGVDFATPAATFWAEVDDASPEAGGVGMAFVWKQMPGGGTTAAAETMRISAAGYVGIGETAPANLLHVKVSDTGITPHASAQIVLERDGTNYLQFLTGNDGTSGLLFGDEDDNDVGKIQYDHNVPAMYFTTEGNLGMALSGGATPTLTLYGTASTGGDAKILFDGEAVDYHIGLDDNLDALRVGVGNALGTTPLISLYATGKGYGYIGGFGGTHTSSGAGTTATGFSFFPVLTGHSGDDDHLSHMMIDGGSITTAGNVDGDPGVIATLFLAEPNISTSHTVDYSATLYIESQATEANTYNYAMWVDAGASRFDGEIQSNSNTQASSIATAYANYGLVFRAAQTINQYSNSIGWSEGTNVAAAISGVDDGSGGAQGLSFATGTNSAITQRMHIKATGEIDLQSNALGLTNVGASGNDWTANKFSILNENSGGKNQIVLKNDSGDANSHAELQVGVDGGTTSSDAFINIFRTTGSNIYWSLGLDNSNTQAFVISNNNGLGTNDALRITTATPPIMTYNTTHPTGTFDYVCDSCGRHEAEQFECCGKVEWHDDVLDFRGMALRQPEAINYMEKVGVIERTLDNDGNPEVFTVLGRDFEFAMSAAFQNRQRMDNQYNEIDKRLAKIEQALGV